MTEPLAYDQHRSPWPVFLHFVDDELVLRLGSDLIDTVGRVRQLIQLVAFLSPEPPLFPLSARHELAELGELLEQLDPLLDAGYLQVTGAGPTPVAYLEARRRQYYAAGSSEGLLFDTAEEHALSRYQAVWVAKTGSSTQAIADAWETNVLAGSGGLLDLIAASARTPADRHIQMLIDLPATLHGQPLILPVILGQLADQGVLASVPTSADCDRLTAYLASEWGRAYATTLNCTVLSDLGTRLPPMNAFRPAVRLTLSGRKLENAAGRLGLLDYVTAIPATSCLRVWPAADPYRMAVAEDLSFRASRSSVPLWNRAEHNALSRFDRQIRRRRFAVAWSRPPVAHARAALELERRCVAYIDTVLSLVDRPPHPTTPFIVDKSINIGQIVGNPQIGSGEYAAFTQAAAAHSDPNEAVAAALAIALRDDTAARGFAQWALNSDPPKQLSVPELQAAVQRHVGPVGDDETVRDRARRIAGDLSLKAGGSLLATGILAALKAIGI